MIFSTTKMKNLNDETTNICLFDMIGCCLHQLAHICGIINQRTSVPYPPCKPFGATKCKRKHYQTLHELANLNKFREVLASIDSKISTYLAGTTLIFADLIHAHMLTRIIDDPLVPGAKMVNTTK